MHTDQLVCADIKILKKFLAVDEKNIVSKFDTHQQKLIYQVDKIARSAFADTQLGKYDVAYKMLRRGMRLASTSHYNRLNILLKTSILPALAYYFYKTKEYRVALSITLEVIDAIDRYECSYIHPSLHCKKIEQLYNISRIYAKSNQPDHYIEASLQVYTYMLAGNKPNCGANWNNLHLAEIPLIIRNNMLLNFYHETVRTSSAFLEDDVRKPFLTELQQLIIEHSPKLQ